jgi:hypothetical protein
LAQIHSADVILHTGNFGFFDHESIDKIHETYLRHIVAFSPILPSEIVDRVSELSRAKGEYVDHADVDKLRELLQGVQLSELMKFVQGEERLEIPVYAVAGMVEDNTVLNKFRLGRYKVHNLNILDESNTYNISLRPQPPSSSSSSSSQVPHGEVYEDEFQESEGEEIDLFICGLGGALSYQKLFHQGVSDADVDELIANDQLPIAGEPGNIWLTMVQIGQFIETVQERSRNSDIKIMLTHPSPSREGLLGHLGVFLKIDYTVSNGLHFLYPSSFNELSICPNFEFYKLKFSESRTQLSSIWNNVQTEIESLISTSPKLTRLLTLALNSFDRIPVTKSDQEITPLSLSFNKRDVNFNTIRLQSDAYYLSFQNQWHFNLCDVNIGSVMLNIEEGRVKFEAKSQGFDFRFRKDGREIRERIKNGAFRGGRGGSGVKRGRGRGRGRP